MATKYYTLSGFNRNARQRPQRIAYRGMYPVTCTLVGGIFSYLGGKL